VSKTPKSVGWEKFKALLLAKAKRAGVKVVCILAEPCPRCGFDASKNIKGARNVLAKSRKKGTR